jgi:DNA-binding GntR family transcriptional regulator
MVGVVGAVRAKSGGDACSGACNHGSVGETKGTLVRPGQPSRPPVERKKRGAVQDGVLAKLRQGLMVGAFIPGQVMNIRNLAALVGTSPMPVRDALSQLLAANALEELPNRSVRVPVLSTARLQELFAVREAIECMAARRACENATPELVESLREINRELIGWIQTKAFRQALDANQRFHFTLYRAAQSEVLMPLIESLWLQCGPTLFFSLGSQNAPWTAAEHTKILTGLNKREVQTVNDAVANDIRSVAVHLLKELRQQEFGSAPILPRQANGRNI